MIALKAWLDRKYYQWNPNALFNEALDYLHLNLWEQIVYAQAASTGMPQRWGTLMWIIHDRMTDYPEGAYLLLPLWAQMEQLGLDKGWCSIVEVSDEEAGEDPIC